MEDKISIRRKISHYKNFQFIYGLYSLLILIDHYELIEDYEECHCIKKGIEENEKILKTKFEKRLLETDFETLTPTMKVIQRSNANKLLNYKH